MIDSTNPRILADNISTLQTTVTAQGNAIEALGSYSSDESETGTTWIDDSKIYRKIFTFEDLPSSATTSITHNISDLSKVIRVYGMLQIDETNGARPLPFVNQVYFIVTATAINVITTSAYTQGQDGFVVLEYTKSAAPSALASPSPDDSRSIEPEVREEAPEEEPIEAESIEEPVVEVKKTTRKKTTTNE